MRTFDIKTIIKLNFCYTIPPLSAPCEGKILGLKSNILSLLYPLQSLLFLETANSILQCCARFK